MLGFIQGLLLIIIEVSIYFFYAQTFCEAGDKITVRRTIATVVVSAVFLDVTSTIFAKHFVIKLLMIVLVLSIMLQFSFRQNWRKSIVLAAIYQSIILVVDFCFIVLASMFLENRIISLSSTQMLLALLSKSILFCLIYIVNKIFIRRKVNAVANRIWLRFMAFPVVTFLMIALLVADLPNIQSVHQVTVYGMLAVCLIAIDFVVVYFLDMIVQEEAEKMLHLEFKNDTEAQMKLYKNICQNNEIQKASIHEFHHHLTCLTSLCEKQKYQELEHYLHNIDQKLSYNVEWMNTNHVIVNTVLNQKYNEAAKRKVLIVCRFNDLKGIWLEDQDVVVILANLLDNAIRASEECEEEHTIYFTMRLIDGTLSLDIQNTYQGPVTIVDNELRTTKREDGRHGYGIKNVQHVVANYGGTFRLSLDSRVLGIHITIPRKI